MADQACFFGGHFEHQQVLRSAIIIHYGLESWQFVVVGSGFRSERQSINDFGIPHLPR